MFAPTPDVTHGAALLSCTVSHTSDTYGGGAALADYGNLGTLAGDDPLVNRLLGVGRYRRNGGLG